MSLQLRMELHILIYKIVSLRVLCGNYEDSATVRGKLERQVQTRIRRVKELEHKSELAVAQALYELYEERHKDMPVASAVSVTRQMRIPLAV